MDEKTYIVVRRGGFRAFLTGALIGAGVALLFAPQSGKQTRDLITEKSTEWKDRAVDIASETRDRAQATYEAARNKINETFQGAKQGGGSDEVKELKRELEITEDINNPSFPL